MRLTPILIIALFTSSLLHAALKVASFGSSSTIAVTFGTATVCAIIANEPTQRIHCYQNGQLIQVNPNISFESISGGFSFFCGLSSGGLSLLCWDSKDSKFEPKRIYFNESIRLTDLAVGDYQVCAREVNSGVVRCWRGGGSDGSIFPSPGLGLKFRTLTSGNGFSCGILRKNSTVHCWGRNNTGAEIQLQFGNLKMLSLVAGVSHACGLTNNEVLVCKGDNEFGQLNVPFSSASEFSGVVAGQDFSCAIKHRNGLLTCWGEASKYELLNSILSEVSFELIVAGLDFLCGIGTKNLSMICWGLGWSNVLNIGRDVPLGMVLPGPCVQSPCSTCGIYPNSETLCGGSGNICKSCQIQLPIAVPLPHVTTPPQSLQPVSSTNARSRLSLAFLIVGSVGAFVGICTLLYFLWGFLHRKYQNSLQPSSIDANANAANFDNNVSTTMPMKSFSVRNHSSRRFGRQRSGSSSKHMDKTESFSLQELIVATKNFSLENKIGAGSFGIVYKGQLADGRGVAIKRGETGMKTIKFQEKESAFDSELVLLSRLHHKHLVELIGFCEEKDERLLVYEYMSNGALHDHLHSKNNTEKSGSMLNSWKVRIKIALDAARGIEYLHNYAVPPIIHRDIKSSNILLDANWTARVSDFGLSLMKPISDQEFMSTKAVGTVGYIDPEYYVSNVLTTKSDVYGLGVVLLELLTGKRAVFKNLEDDTGPMGVVEYATPLIAAGEVQRILDKRVGAPEKHEAEAVELMAYTAMHCVNLEGKERPNIIDIVATLERAFSLCEESNGSFRTSFSIPSD